MPDGSFNIPRALDHEQLDPFLQRLLVVTAGHDGCLVAFGAGEAPGTYETLPPQIHVVENGPDAVPGLLDAFEQINRVPGLNGYVSIGLFKPREQWIKPNGRGSEADLVGTLAFVGDFDAARGDPDASVERLLRLPVSAHCIVETSLGSYQAWVLLDQPYSVAEAKPVFAALTGALGGDATFSCEHVFRPPGTWNWPTQKKVRDYGRSPEPQLARRLWLPPSEPEQW